MNPRGIYAASALILFALNVGAMPAPGTPQAPNDPRYCGDPARDKEGRIKRSRTELAKFVAIFPCPATLRSTISCEGWQIDHIIPLGSGGCDKTINMQWLPTEIKTCKTATCKDRWERRYHTLPRTPLQFQGK